MNQYIIVGDTEEHGECLVYICGNNEDKAKETLNRILTNPTERDKRVTAGIRNLRVKEVPREDCWWLDGCN